MRSSVQSNKNPGKFSDGKSRRIPNPEEGLYKALKILASSEVRVIIGKENWAETMRRLRVPSTAPKTLSSPGKVIIINYIENKLKSSTYRTVPPTLIEYGGLGGTVTI